MLLWGWGEALSLLNITNKSTVQITLGSQSRVPVVGNKLETKIKSRNIDEREEGVEISET